MSLPPYWVAAVGAVPALAAMWYFDRHDRARPEPRGLRRKVAIFGGLSVLPVLGLVALLNALVGDAAPPPGSYEEAFYTAFAQAAAPEELCKIAVVYWVVWRRPEFDERMDGIVYAARAGLGFALVENIFYLLAQVELSALIMVWVLRAALAVPGHALWTGIMGYLAARRRFDRTGPGLFGGYLLAVFLHGTYDAALFVGPPLRADGLEAVALGLFAVPVLIIVVSWILIKRMARTALRLDDAQHGHGQRKALG